MATQGDRTVRVFLLDDHEVVRQGVAALLRTQPDLTVVGEASTAAEALTRVPALRPDVAVLDVRLPDGDGVQVCRQLRAQLPELACLMLTSYADDEALFESVMAGAAGYLLKELRGADLVQAIRTVASGVSLLDPTATHQLLSRLRGANDSAADPLRRLTEPQRLVFELIGKGMTDRQIATALRLAEHTVKHEVAGLLAKLGMRRRAQAAALAARLGRRPPGPPRIEGN